jgi:hypothetical protein
LIVEEIAWFRRVLDSVEGAVGHRSGLDAYFSSKARIGLDIQIAALLDILRSVQDVPQEDRNEVVERLTELLRWRSRLGTYTEKAAEEILALYTGEQSGSPQDE